MAMPDNPADPDEIECVGFWKRSLAYGIDSLLLMAVLLPLAYLIYGPEYFTMPEPGQPMLHGAADVLLTYVLPPVAVIAFWVFRAATPGKMAIGARIVRAEDGGHPSLGRFIGRYAAYILSALPLGLGFLWIAFDARKQGWHDKLAGTLVVRRRRGASRQR